MSSKKKKKTNVRYNVNQQKQTLPPYLLVLGAVCGIMIIVTIISAIVMANREPKVEFIPPEFESAASVGVPEVPEELDYKELTREGMTYTAYICGLVRLENGEAVVYFTNPAKNETWIKLRISDEDGNVLGETGLLRPGEYIRAVPLDREVAPGTAVKLRIMGYEPDTYLSEGSVNVNTVVSP